MELWINRVRINHSRPVYSFLSNLTMSKGKWQEPINFNSTGICLYFHLVYTVHHKIQHRNLFVFAGGLSCWTQDTVQEFVSISRWFTRCNTRYSAGFFSIFRWFTRCNTRYSTGICFYFQVVYPLQHKISFTYTKAKVTVALIWIFSFAFQAAWIQPTSKVDITLITLITER